MVQAEIYLHSSIGDALVRTKDRERVEREKNKSQKVKYVQIHTYTHTNMVHAIHMAHTHTHICRKERDKPEPIQFAHTLVHGGYKAARDKRSRMSHTCDGKHRRGSSNHTNRLQKKEQKKRVILIVNLKRPTSLTYTKVSGPRLMMSELSFLTSMP